MAWSLSELNLRIGFGGKDQKVQAVGLYTFDPEIWSCKEKRDVGIGRRIPIIASYARLAAADWSMSESPA
jgi:hypothetical protein